MRRKSYPSRMFSGQPIKGWLVRPRGAEGRLPAVVSYVGYGGGRGRPHDHLLWASAGYAHLVMDTRGQGAGWSRAAVRAAAWPWPWPDWSADLAGVLADVPFLQHSRRATESTDAYSYGPGSVYPYNGHEGGGAHRVPVAPAFASSLVR